MAGLDNLEAKHRRGQQVLAAAYERAQITEPRHNGRLLLQQLTTLADLQGQDEDDEEFELRKKHWRGFIKFIFADGPRPDRAAKRLYAIAWCVARESLLGMNLRELGDLLGETKASPSNRVNCQFSDYLKLWGFNGTRVHGQKSESSRAVFAEQARGNTSRRHGKKKGDSPSPKHSRKSSK